MAITSAQTGHGVRKTNWPLWKMLAGYLNRSSNMSPRQRHIATSIGTCLQEVGVTVEIEIGGKVHRSEALASFKDTTPNHCDRSVAFQGCHAPIRGGSLPPRLCVARPSAGVDWFNMKRSLLAGILLA